MLSRNKRRVFFFFFSLLSFSCLPKINLPTEQRWLPLKEPHRSSTFQFPAALLWPLTPDLFNPVTKSTLSASCVCSELSSTTAPLLRSPWISWWRNAFFFFFPPVLLSSYDWNTLMVLITQRGEPILSRLTVKSGRYYLAADHRQKNTIQTPASSPKPSPPLRFFPCESADQKSLNPFNSPVSARILTKPTQRDTLFVSARKDLHSQDTPNSATSAGGRKMPSGGPATEACASSAWVFLQCSVWPATAAPSGSLTEREREGAPAAFSCCCTGFKGDIHSFYTWKSASLLCKVLPNSF